MNAVIGAPAFALGCIFFWLGAGAGEYDVIPTMVGTFLIGLGGVMLGVWMYERR